MSRLETTDDLDALMAALPPEIVERLRGVANRSDLLEVVMDLGRRPEARFTHGEEVLLDREVTEADIAHVIEHIGAFGDDNRAGIERTLHRISAIRNRGGKVVGLTCRIGRAVFGTIDIIRDIVESGRSILILGRPGVGKTTMLREVARVLADDLGKRVIVVDTSNEIAGDGDIPHPGIGDARRMQVRTPTDQHSVMIEAVENHMPEVIIIDEIGTELEAAAARTIAERGVQLVGTAHGNTLDNLMLNPTLSDLVGGIQTVTLGDEEARRRGTQKTVLERKAPPTFDVVVEIVERDNVIVHRNVAETVDAILRGHMVPPEARWRDENGELRAATKYDYRISETAAGNPAFAPLEPTGGFGAYSGRQRGAMLSATGLRPLPGRGAGGGRNRTLPGERNRTLPDERLTGDRYEPAETSDPRRLMEQALRDAEAAGPGREPGREPSEEELLDRPIGATRPASAAARSHRPLSLFAFGVSRKRLEQAVREMGVPVTAARELDEADAVVTLRNYYRRKPSALREAESNGIPIYVLKTNTMQQMESLLASLFDLETDPSEAALRETAEAIGLVQASGRPVELMPQNAYIRRLQHQMAERHNLMSRSRGTEPNRRVELLPDEGRAWR
ncbi:MAG TPA: R3H domain-containing nucleic acid-binding protein [candidate division Zixibacteria bacterium]|nr:R3H domain-containing nucleic acid-binding protein [candidate division Zixibacteria bacterium]